MEEETTVQVKKVPNPTGKGGFGDNPQNRNNGGRIKNTLKEFQREEFERMTPEQKRDYLKDMDKYKVWTMAEGNPDSKNETTGKVEVLLIDKELAPLYGIRTAQETNGSSQEPSEVQGS